MRNRWSIALLGLTAFACAAPVESDSVTPAATLAIRDVIVIDVVDGVQRPGQTVLIRDDRIVEIGTSGQVDVPRGARIVEGSGLYLMPGLWDMHVHATFLEESSLGAFVANGVLGVRDMGADSLEILERWSQRIRSGTVVGPRIIAAGPILDNAPPEWPLRVAVPDASRAQAVVDSLVTAGADLIKVHVNLPRDAYFAVAEAAERHGVPFAGHLPRAVTLAEAAQAGQRSVEHVMEVTLPEDTVAGPLYARLRTNPLWVTPTLIAAERVMRLRDTTFAGDPRARFVTPALAAFWQAQLSAWPDVPESFLRDLYEASAGRTTVLDSAGVPLLAGSDLGFIHVYPGTGLLEELELMVEAGLTPAEALRTATINPALYLGMEDVLGNVAVGAFADLLLLSSNPLENLVDAESIRAVVLGGRYLDRTALDGLLDEAARSDGPQ